MHNSFRHWNRCPDSLPLRIVATVFLVLVSNQLTVFVELQQLLGDGLGRVGSGHSDIKWTDTPSCRACGLVLRAHDVCDTQNATRSERGQGGGDNDAVAALRCLVCDAATPEELRGGGGGGGGGGTGAYRGGRNGVATDDLDDNVRATRSPLAGGGQDGGSSCSRSRQGIRSDGPPDGRTDASARGQARSRVLDVVDVCHAARGLPRTHLCDIVPCRS